MPAEDWQSAGFGIYIHWPFCQSKCPYCDFNSHVRASVDQGRWWRALLAELAAGAGETPGRRVETVFFGGGTPSLMAPETVADILTAIGQHWHLAPDAEITLEANPGSVEAGRFAAYAAAGVNRVSMGIQSLRDHDLKRLGRLHSAAEARAAFDIARNAFERVSFDLIYARQDQTLADWQAELTEACAMAVDHLSLYQLTIETGTRFAELHARGTLRGLPEDALATDMFFATRDICAANGMMAYEVSNHARPGAECRHNLIYWRYGDYLGIGPGAHGRITRNGRKFAVETERHPETWLDLVEKTGTGRISETEISLSEQADEYLMMCLRLTSGIDIERLTRLRGSPPDTEALVQAGFVTVTKGYLAATDKGMPVLNAILRELLT